MSKPTKIAPAPRLGIPPIRVAVEAPATKHEMGTIVHTHGDAVIQEYIIGDRRKLADKLAELSCHVASVMGDPIASAEIVVLLRRPR
jgi:hypothetical protein